MPLRKVFVDKEGDDDKKSINDALSWFLQKFTLIHFPGHSDLQLLSNTINTGSVMANFESVLTDGTLFFSKTKSACFQIGP